MGKKVFLICPVRDADKELKKRMNAYVGLLEARGYKVHFPHRDTNQSDPTGGFIICKTNFNAILEADEVHVWYDEASCGSKFDLGCLFALWMSGIKKKIVIVNELEAEAMDDPPKNTFFKMLREFRRQCN
ncbi:MAG: hypothetical protein HYT12_00245 [Candidatus Liptonbacteria bacterium]|nr:hypothetical protein [Candidatus Liptonbacteria bacterium]